MRSSTKGLPTKNWIGFGYISSKNYELDLNFYEIYTKCFWQVTRKKDKLFREKIVDIEEEWFYEINLTDGATFPSELTKREK